jgi:hypothetical protein
MLQPISDTKEKGSEYVEAAKCNERTFKRIAASKLKA